MTQLVSMEPTALAALEWLVLRRMSTQAVYFVVKRRAKDARIGDLSPAKSKSAPQLFHTSQSLPISQRQQQA